MGSIIRMGSACLTSKVSREHGWRISCVSTKCDKHDRWLHCLVRLRFHFIPISYVTAGLDSDWVFMDWMVYTSCSYGRTEIRLRRLVLNRLIRAISLSLRPVENG